MKLVIMLLVIVGCTTTGKLAVKPCHRSETYICEIRGTHKDCWCQDTIQLRRQIIREQY